MTDYGVDLYRVVGVLRDAFQIATGLPIIFRKSHALDVNAASSNAHRLTKLMETMGEAANAGAAQDRELRRLVRAIRRESCSLRGRLDQEFKRTIRYGPGHLGHFDEQAHRIQALILRAQERTQDLLHGRAAVSIEAECVGFDGRWHNSIPVAMVQVALKLTPILHQGRYHEEWMGELLEQKSWADKFDYSFRALVRSGIHRRNLADVIPYRAVASSAVRDEA